MLEDIRVYIMRRWADNRDRIIEYPREVLPRIRIKVEKQADASGKWVSTYAGRDKYEVTRRCVSTLTTLLRTVTRKQPILNATSM
ncbi:hypothetical protein AHAS_Ahas18G0064600 [Arachis hypogaea]